MQAKFYTQGDSFVIEAFNNASPFSSFFPGLAGVTGKPMWVFFTNRGQAIAGFGVNDKDGAMMEFLPANKAYQATSLVGFRTFIKRTAPHPDFYEPFINHNTESMQMMIIRSHELEIKDINKKLGLETKITYFGVPQEDVPVLARRLTIQNLSNQTVSLQVVDGIPRVVPLGMDNFLVKNMSRTIEAFAVVENMNERVPFFQLKIQPDDRADISFMKAGFFSLGVTDSSLLPVIVDPNLVFGQDTSLLKPAHFIEKKNLSINGQLTSSIMPSSLFLTQMKLAPRQTKSIESYYGYAENVTKANRFASKIKSNKNYFEEKRKEMHSTVEDVVDHFGFKSANKTLNQYADVTFMDNVLRGGFPMSLGPKGPVVHVYSRKHGDMERDYNNFQISATYYSQGNGNFRDVSQNRRNDLYLNPQVGTANLDFFFNLLQLDGYNPLVIDPVKFLVPYDLLTKMDFKMSDESKSDFDHIKREPMLAGKLYEFAQKHAADPLGVDNLFKEMIRVSVPHYSVRHGEGFWIDHWIYNLDHLDQYLSVFPDKKTWLFFEKDDFSYFDSDHFVRPRREKYVVTPDGRLRQYQSVQLNQQKRALISSRKNDPQKVRVEAGKGDVFQTTFFIKLLSLVVTKVSTLDPFGVGLEMEADKPGWCDALNGLPGLFGSSTHEMFELHRLVKLLKNDVLPLSPNKTIEIPQEIYSFYRDVAAALSLDFSKDFRPVWNEMTTAREMFREKTFFGVSGKTRAVRLSDIVAFLGAVSKTLERAEKLSIDPITKLPTSYFSYEVDVQALSDGWRQFLDKLPWKQHRIQPFLEGPVHYMKMLSTPKAKQLYLAVKRSLLADKKLGMYRLNVSLQPESSELGRIKAFSPGWLENESIFLHMHYKFLLELLRRGMTDIFFKEIQTGLIPFRDPKTYGRSIFENSSFIASSSFPDPSIHGKGFVARLSGATSEFLSMIFFMFFGPKMFKMIDNQIVFSPDPVLPKEWFTVDDTLAVGKNMMAVRLFGVPIRYVNSRRKNTFGTGAVKPVKYEWIFEGRFHHHVGRSLVPEASERLREGQLESLTIVLG